MRRIVSVFVSASVVVCALLWGGTVGAQQATLPGDTELRAEQQRLAAALFEDPSNLELMFAHAEASIKLRDYESAITTLERLLIYDQNLTRVRLELGVAYFNLGSYEIAALYLNQALKDEGVDDATRVQVQSYLGEIEQRTAENRLEFVANLGLTYASNANLGPVEDTVTIAGIPGFVLSPRGRSQDDFGVRILLFGSHSYDLGRPNDDAWLTNATIFGVRYFEVEQGNVISLRLRTGPRLNLTDESGGARIRPYAEFAYLNSSDETVYYGGFVGAELNAPIIPAWSFFADLNAGYLEYSDARVGQDRHGFRGTAGVSFQPTRRVVARAAGLFERYTAETGFNSSTEFGARVSGGFSYDPGLDFVKSLWLLTGYADVRSRRYGRPDPFIDPSSTRKEFDIRGGIGHLFAVSDGFGVQLDVEGFLREANIQNFDLNNVSLTLSAQYRF